MSIIAVVLAIMTPVYIQFSTAFKVRYINEQQTMNIKIATAMENYAEQDPLGSLPSPYTGGSINNGIVNPGGSNANDVLFRDLLRSEAAITQMNDDAFASARVRVYQRLTTGQSITQPAYGAFGPAVLIKYQTGFVYNTECPRATSACNPSASGVPGDSPVLSASNVDSWATSGNDHSSVMVTNLGAHKKKLDDTTSKIKLIQNKIIELVNIRTLAGTPGSSTNYLPAATGVGAPNLSGASPGTNEGCYDGWYDLSVANVNILPQLGLSKGEFGTTSWGAVIQYCRDYDSLASGSNTAPHYGAIRVNYDLTTGIAPTNATTNAIFTF